MSKRKKLNDDNLTQAMEAVKSKTLSIRAAAEAYDINRESLRRRVAKGEVGKGAGRPNVLPDDVEQKLVGYIKKRCEMNIGVTSLQLRKKAMEVLAVSPHRDHYQSRRKDEQFMGRRWLRAFLERHNLSRHTPQSLEMSRIGAFTVNVKLDFFALYERVYTDVGVAGKPHILWNYDEKNQQFLHKPAKVIAPKGKKCDAVSSDIRESFTIVLMINALGRCLAPVIIVYKR